MKRMLTPVSIVATLAVLCCSILEAGKPKPPPPPPDPATIYQWRPELGGWLDTTRNLVWGYNTFPDVLGYGITLNMAIQRAATYPGMLYDMGLRLEGDADYYDDLGDRYTVRANEYLAAGDLVNAQKYFDQANGAYAQADEKRASIPACVAAGDAASQFNNWRVPTEAEALDAIAKRLFTYGAGGFNGYDHSPYLGLQPDTNNANWTTTLSKNKQQAVVYRPSSGESGYYGVNSQISCIYVRTHVP